MGLLVTTSLCSAAAGSTRNAPAPDHDPLCGIARPIDNLLDCRATAPDAYAPIPSGGAPTAETPASESPVREPPASNTPVALQALPPSQGPAAARFMPDRLLVSFRLGTSRHEQAEALARAGVILDGAIPDLPVVVVRMPASHRAAALAILARSPVVAMAEKDAVLRALDTTPNDTDWSAQWGLQRVGFPRVWDQTRGSGSTVVAVLDTGVDPNQADLRGALLPGSNFVDPGAPSVDDNGHGTAVAGIIAARANNHQGIAGVCWACAILPIKVLGADGTGDTAAVAAGIVRAADTGAHVISMSLGGPADDSTLDQAVAYALSSGAIVVAAAGNDGSSRRFYPAALPGVISVAATDESDRLYPWSDYGSWVQVAAPGCNPAPAGANSYFLFCGTSSATPVVAGLAALALSTQERPDRDRIINTIEQSAVPDGTATAHGRIDAKAALAAPATAPSQSPVAIFTAKGLLTRRSRTRSYQLTVGPTTITATLDFADARRLTLTLRNNSGALISRVTSTSPIKISRPLTHGSYTLDVSTLQGSRARFQLGLSASGTPPRS
jgi:subtilisin family serine protease